MIIKLYNLFFLTATLPELNFKHSALITSSKCHDQNSPLMSGVNRNGLSEMRQRGHEESERTLERDNKLEKKRVSRTETQKRKDKRHLRTKNGIRAASSSVDEPLLTFLVWGNCSCAQTNLWSQHVWMVQADWLAPSDWRTEQHLQVWLRVVPEPGPWCSQILPPPLPKPADLWNIMHLCLVAKQDVGLCRIKACGGHQCIAQSHQAESSFLLPGWIPLIFHRRMLGVAPFSLLCFI